MLHGAWWVHYARGEFAAARELAAQMLDLGHQDGDAAVRLTALNALGLVEMAAGKLPAARDNLEAALEVHTALADVLPPTQFVQDPGVEARAALALICWMMGEPAQARALARRAVDLAVANRHPVSLVTALTCAAIMHSYAGEFDAVQSLTERVRAVIQQESLPTTPGDEAWLHGRALVVFGQVDEGLAGMRAAARGVEATGMCLGIVGFYYQYAEACHAAGRHDDARAAIDAGLPLAEIPDGQQLLSQLLRLNAEERAREDDAGAADALLRRAIAVAREQGAGFFELAALASAKRIGAQCADAARLEELLARFGRPEPRSCRNAGSVIGARFRAALQKIRTADGSQCVRPASRARSRGG